MPVALALELVIKLIQMFQMIPLWFTNHRRSRYLESIVDAIQPGLAETQRGSVGWHSEGAERSEAPRCDPKYT